MPNLDRIAAKNQEAWTRWARTGGLYTRPWLELPRELVLAYVSGKIEVMPEPYAYMYPREAFRDVGGREVLCLASGGGQQSAFFGLLGARVTVYDLTEAQLESDRLAAQHHGYPIATVQGDMRDLSVFSGGSFDIVFQEISICFVPDVRPVYREVARVLRPGGLYRVAHCNPATQLVGEGSWDGQGYRISQPYGGGELADPDDELVEFRHLLPDMFNGLVEAGLSIEGVWEDPRHLHPKRDATPGTYEHMLTWVQQYFAILARKPE